MSYDPLGNLMVSTDPTKDLMQLLSAVFDQLRIANANLAKLVNAVRRLLDTLQTGDKS